MFRKHLLFSDSSIGALDSCHIELEISQETLSACSEIGDSQETIPYVDEMREEERQEEEQMAVEENINYEASPSNQEDLSEQVLRKKQGRIFGTIDAPNLAVAWNAFEKRHYGRTDGQTLL